MGDIGYPRSNITNFIFKLEFYIKNLVLKSLSQ